VTRFIRATCLVIAIGIGLLAAIPVALAQDPRTWMSQGEILSAFVGRQLAGIYPSGAAWREQIRPDGTSDYREGTAQREGRWWMRGDQFCFAYDRPQSGGCFQVAQVGANCYELFSVGIGGGAEAPPADSKRHWNGRMWREDTSATCDEKPTV
jgi:hypothetical protein